MRLLILTISICFLSGCFRHDIESSPPMQIPKNILSPIPKPTSYISSSNEVYDYCIHSINLSNKKLELIKEYQKKFNKINK